jgi:acyl-CoA reductase-like NAD-dependent aldehyde dehydrogenase
MSNVQTTIAPHTQQACCVRTYPTEAQVEETIVKAAKAQVAWKEVPLKDRIAICHRFLDQMQTQKDEAAKEITDQIGRSVAISCACSDRRQ